MPFERYLRDDSTTSNGLDLNYYYQHNRHPYDDADCHFAHGQPPYLPEASYDHRTPHAVQFQIPQFMLNGPPVLAPGGGAEVLPAGLLENGPDSFTSTWLANNGFTSLHSAPISSQVASGPIAPESVNAASSSFDSCQKHYTADLALERAVTSNVTSYTLTGAHGSESTSPPPVTGSATHGLPVYSASGFDVLSILSRVVNRPNPTIPLGPVDLSCSFVIVDVRRHDCPVVYASPAFYQLTGYSEEEVLGRNCRFLQSPTGNIAKGEPRRFVPPEAVSYMHRSLSSSKECQTTLVNYRKSGQAFINLVTVIPLRGGIHNAPEEANEIAYHIGFQVDLTEQPIRILDKLRDGSYRCIDNSWGMDSLSGHAGLSGTGHGLGQLVQAQNMTNVGPKAGRHGQMMSIAVSKDLKSLFADTTFTDAVPISTGANVSGVTGASTGSCEQGSSPTTPLTMLVTPPSNTTSMSRATASSTMAGSTPVFLSPSLSLLLLEFLPDFLLVLSLKGAFLYVAPSVRLVLGYEPQELVGRTISDVCHPADLVPLMRELKEGSVNGLGVPGTSDVGSTTPPSNLLPKSVDLLFRALPKASSSSLSGAQSASAGQSGFRSSRSPSTSSPAPQSPPSSGTLNPNDSLDETALPYVWLECRGRLHIEPGKGRKAIILSGRARWMPVVRWGSVTKSRDMSGAKCHGKDTHNGLHMMPAYSDTIGPLEFWALLSLQGTFLVASASVRDILGWGSSEIIGRSIWAMERVDQTSVREHVEAELIKLDKSQSSPEVDPPPTVVVTSLLHKESRTVPVRLVFHRTPQSHGHAPAAPIGDISGPYIRPLNPLRPIVCQATVLSNTEQQSHNVITGLGPYAGKVVVQDEQDIATYASGASLFDELETYRGSSWQYELQQLKFANQRLHEELNALQGPHRDIGPVVGPSSGTEPITAEPLSQPYSSLLPITIPATSQPSRLFPTQLRFPSLMHSTVPSPLGSVHLINTLHEQDPPSSEWSSLAGANGQGPNPLKRSWRSGDGPTTT